MSFAPPDSPEERVHRRQLAGAANAALRGETHNTGTVKVAAGAAFVVLKDPRLSVEKVVTLTALDAVAAGLGPWLDRAAGKKGEAVIRFTATPAQECAFDYTITGIQRYGA